MARENTKNEPTDAQILSRLRRAKNGKTAKDLGTTAARLRALDGVVQVGTVKTGKAGRPAILFGLGEVEAVRSGAASEQVVSGDDSDE